jgi:drug/metabolite transporter (DMT)-like permease
VANATVLCNLTPVVVTLFAWLVWKERPRAAFVLALMLAIGGAVAMGMGAPPGQGTNPLLGDLFSLSVTLWYSGYFLAVQTARRTAGAMQVTLWASLAGVPLMALAAVVLREDMLPSSALGWAACVGLGFTHVAGQGGVAWALGRLPASLTAVTILVQPIVAAVLGWMVFGETLGPVQALGGALVLGAVVLAQASSRARPVDTKTGAEAKAAAPVET